MTEEHSISLQPGTVIGGKYEVVKCLGSGSMGLVYACRHRELQGQIVAVKVLFPEVALDKVASARFKNEILASYEISHPNVVRAYEYLTDRDLVAYTMEFVGGGDLAEKLSDPEPISIADIVKWLSQMAAGCQAIHDAGIVHRDLKPENILLTAEGNVKIADFGIARHRHGPKLTEHGGVVGTIDYVAPEYMLKSQVDWRSDIYALGILAYEMVTGEAPFKGDSVYATMTKRLKTDPEPPSTLRSDCPPELDWIILRAMQRDPESRYQSAMAMCLELQKLDVAATPGGALLVPSQAEPSGSPSLNSEQYEPVAQRAQLDYYGGGQVGVGVDVSPTTFDSSVAESIQGRREDCSQDMGEGEAESLRGDSRSESSPGALVNYTIEAGGQDGYPGFGPEPLMDSSTDLLPSGIRTPSRADRSSGVRGGATVARQAAEKQTYFGDMIALGFAAAVGIGCGFLFLKIFAPSLVGTWHF